MKVKQSFFSLQKVILSYKEFMHGIKYMECPTQGEPLGNEPVTVWNVAVPC
jgi:hypothetical protein